ncbi:MAG: hypothetical protein HOC91_11735 [Nitrospinaceae bacterium]|jgi:hypothetical protein|nr:hypothetical protein [Nitrospinaceae bacterium]MBT3432450.1 hypothetical protein [Nitrospinaceae bacterium]MBT3823116.1 hypothetical protein [Nitrospinaceae bacterium]MBT4093242.1 hypothetical protein [Nitrospinaceae bacterium]MBT4431178.1 hypothetical protein [Nitrospinaceae bacterium]
MKFTRLIWMASILIVVFGIAVSTQIYVLYGKLQSRERTIRLLNAEVQRKSNVPARTDFGSVMGSSISARLKLRSNKKEIDELMTNLMFVSGELDEVKKDIGVKEKTILNQNREIGAAKKRMSILLVEKKKNVEQLVLLRAGSAAELAEKQAQVEALQKRNAELLELVEKFKEDTGNLKKKKKESSKQKLPKALEEKIRNLSGN